MVSALLTAVGQLRERELRVVLWRALLVTLAGFVAVLGGFSYLVDGIPLTGVEWLDPIIPWLATVAVALVLFLIFPSVATLLLLAFLDDVAEAVERRHYSGDPPGRPLSVGAALLVSLRFSAGVILLNLAALPLYVILGMNVFVFYGLNGYLLGREYYELVALRHLDRAAAASLRRANRGRLFLAGIVIAVALTVPVVNIVAPLVAAAFMVHVFKDLTAKGTV